MTSQLLFRFNCLVVFGFSLTLAQPAVAGDFQLIASTGDATPDVIGALSQFGTPVLNNNGQIAFHSSLNNTTGGTADDFALYRSDGTSLTRIARKGVTMVDGETIEFLNPFHLSMNNGGAVLTSVRVVGDSNFFTILGDGGPLQAFQRVGDPSPSGNNALFAHTQVGINDAGESVFSGLHSGVNQEAGIYQRNADGSYTILLLEGDVAPQGGTIDSLFVPSINQTNQVGALGEILENAQVDSAVLRMDTLGTTQLARRGDMLSDGITVLEDIKNVSTINASGNLGFAADFTQPGRFPEGVFLAADAGVTLLAEGFLPGATVAAGFIQVADLNSANQVAFTAEVTPGLDRSTGIYVADASGVELIALENTPTPRGDHFFHAMFRRNIAMNDQGQVVFEAELADEIAGAKTGRGLFFYDPVKGLEQVLTTGDSFLGDTIAGLEFSGVQPEPTGSPGSDASGANDQGQIAFQFSLTTSGDQGIAVWSPTALPGDFDNDGDVDGFDFLEWQRNGGSTASLAAWESNYGFSVAADFDQDGDVDGADFLKWQRGESPNANSATDLANWEASYGTGAPLSAAVSAASTAVPEPATAIMLMLGTMAMLFHRDVVDSTWLIHSPWASWQPIFST